jgi:hypothetical protein
MLKDVASRVDEALLISTDLLNMYKVILLGALEIQIDLLMSIEK